MTKITPTNEEDDNVSERSESSSSILEDTAKDRKLSIRCYLIFLVVASILVTVLLLTGIWIVCFTTSVVRTSENVMSSQFSKTITYTTETISKLLLTSQNAKNTLWYNFDYQDTTRLNLLAYKIYKSSEPFFKGLIETVYFGDTKGGNKGILLLGGEPTLMFIDETGQYYSYCMDIPNNEYCKTRNQSEWDVVFGPFDMSKIMGVAQRSPNNPSFSLSYTDPTLPSITFMSMVNSHPVDKVGPDGFNYDWYFGIDISVSSISNYLESISKEIANSCSFIIELKTDFIVACRYLYYGS